MHPTDIIIRPLVTEKSTHLQNTRNTYAFEVSPDADKGQIRQAVEQLYSVKVVEVRTMVRKGKPRRSRHGVSRTSDFKRAIVQLHEDSKIELF